AEARAAAAAAAAASRLESGRRSRDTKSATEPPSPPSAPTADASDCGAGDAGNENAPDRAREDESRSIAERVGSAVVVAGGGASGAAAKKDSPGKDAGKASSARGVEVSAMTGVPSKGKKGKVARKRRADKAEVEDGRHVVDKGVPVSPSSRGERPAKQARPERAKRVASYVDEDSHEESEAVPAEVVEGSAVADVRFKSKKGKVARKGRTDKAEVEDGRPVVDKGAPASPSSRGERPAKRARPKRAKRAASYVDGDSHEETEAVPAEVVEGSAVADVRFKSKRGKVARKGRADKAEVEDGRHVVDKGAPASPSSRGKRSAKRARPILAKRAASYVDGDSHEETKAVPAGVFGNDGAVSASTIAAVSVGDDDMIGDADDAAAAAVPDTSKTVKKKEAKTVGTSNLKAGATSTGVTARGNGE
ncbi:unnamed protein product, partial [Sphacelaria rigidula]